MLDKWPKSIWVKCTCYNYVHSPPYYNIWRGGCKKNTNFPYTNFQRKAFLKNYRNYIVLFNLVALEKLLLLSSIKMAGLGGFSKYWRFVIVPKWALTRDWCMVGPLGMKCMIGHARCIMSYYDMLWKTKYGIEIGVNPICQIISFWTKWNPVEVISF
jgi:hypothetical protein